MLGVAERLALGGESGRVRARLVVDKRLLLLEELLLVDLAETDLALLVVECHLFAVLVLGLDRLDLALDVVERLVLDALLDDGLERLARRGARRRHLARRVVEVQVLLEQTVLRTRLGRHLALQLPLLVVQRAQHRLVHLIDLLAQLLLANLERRLVLGLFLAALVVLVVVGVEQISRLLFSRLLFVAFERSFLLLLLLFLSVLTVVLVLVLGSDALDVVEAEVLAVEVDLVEAFGRLAQTHDLLLVAELALVQVDQIVVHLVAVQVVGLVLIQATFLSLLVLVLVLVVVLVVIFVIVHFEVADFRVAAVRYAELGGGGGLFLVLWWLGFANAAAGQLELERALDQPVYRVGVAVFVSVLTIIFIVINVIVVVVVVVALAALVLEQTVVTVQRLRLAAGARSTHLAIRLLLGGGGRRSYVERERVLVHERFGEEARERIDRGGRVAVGVEQLQLLVDLLDVDQLGVYDELGQFGQLRAAGGSPPLTGRLCCRRTLFVAVAVAVGVDVVVEL